MPFDLIPLAVASAAAVLDVRYRKIPNWLTLGALVLGLALHLVREGPSGLVAAGAGAVLGLALLLPFYVLGSIGAGDVKLLAGLGALVGPHMLVSVAVYTALVGGVIAAYILLRQGRLQFALADVLAHPRSVARSGARAPYGVAIAGGVYLATLLPSVIG